jgi:polysaccharide export outer membrane protein
MAITRLLSFLVVILCAVTLQSCAASVDTAPLPGLSDPAQAAPDEAPVSSSVATFRPGDSVELEVYRVDTISGKYGINRFGMADFPLIGEVPVAGLSTGQLQEELKRRYGERYLNDPTIIVRREAAIRGKIVVGGAVKKPGYYELESLLRLSDAVAIAGGPSEDANTRRVFLRRWQEGGVIIMEYDLVSILTNQAPDPLLRANDTVAVADAPFKGVARDFIRTIPFFGVLAR